MNVFVTLPVELAMTNRNVLKMVVSKNKGILAEQLSDIVKVFDDALKALEQVSKETPGGGAA